MNLMQSVQSIPPSWLVVGGLAIGAVVGLVTLANYAASKVWSRAWDARGIKESIDRLTATVDGLRTDFQRVIELDKKVALMDQRLTVVEERPG